MTRVLQLVNGVARGIEVSTTTPYDESIYYDNGLSASTTITLPNSGSFSNADASDLLIIFNKKVVELTRDFTVVGAGPTYTQIQFVYALPDDSVLNFRQGI